MCIFLLQINWFIMPNAARTLSSKGWNASQHYENCKHSLLCAKCMQIANVGNHHTQTHTQGGRWLERQEEKCFIKTKKYRVREWKRVFNNKLNKKQDLSLRLCWTVFIRYVHDVVFRIEHMLNYKSCTFECWLNEREKTKHRKTHTQPFIFLCGERGTALEMTFEFIHKDDE